MASLKTIRLDGDNEYAQEVFEAFLKELGIDSEDNAEENEEQ